MFLWESRYYPVLFDTIYILTPNSLSIKVSPEKLEEDLTDMISAFGRCHVKIKLSQGLKKLPVGFVQFEVSALFIYILYISYDICKIYVYGIY